MARVVRVGSGATLLVAGLAMLVLPGPGLLTIGAALTVLRHDVPVADRLLEWIRGSLPKVPQLT